MGNLIFISEPTDKMDEIDQIEEQGPTDKTDEIDQIEQIEEQEPIEIIIDKLIPYNIILTRRSNMIFIENYEILQYVGYRSNYKIVNNNKKLIIVIKMNNRTISFVINNSEMYNYIMQIINKDTKQYEISYYVINFGKFDLKQIPYYPDTYNLNYSLCL
jgi:hypothetical protein